MTRPNRRVFLTGCATAGLAGLAAGARGASRVRPMHRTIERIELFPLSYPTRGRFKFFEGPRGEPAGRPAVAVKITASDGAVGWGQSVPVPRWSYETLETVVTTIDRHLGPALLGLDPGDMAAIEERVNRTIAPSFSTGQPICKAGIDLALHDLNARAQGLSVPRSWQRQGRETLQLSWTLNPRTLDDVEDLVAEGKAHGYRHFNVKVAPDPEFDVELCRMVRRLVPDGFLWADANGGYDLDTALGVAPRLAELGVPVLEQPLPPNRLEGYRRLKKQGALPILMDEAIVSAVELDEFIRLGMLDGISMKPARCGGLAEARRQIERCQQDGLIVLGSGLTDPDLSLAASLQLYAAYDLPDPFALNGPQFLEGSILKTPMTVVDGSLRVPRGAGLGVEVDESKLGAMRPE